MSDLDRYSRQTLLPEIGDAGQEQLLKSSVAVVGCGALGSVIASTLVRAGVGRVRIIDRDYIELSNLQRQILFDEEDIARGLPKAVAAAEKLRQVNSQVKVEPVVADVNPDNVERFIGDVDLVLDGTDNFEVRFLLNDACVKHTVPWVYGGVLATYGMVRAIIPHRTPCFRCFLAEKPMPGSTPTCDTVGALAPAVNVVASLEDDGTLDMWRLGEAITGRTRLVCCTHVSNVLGTINPVQEIGRLAHQAGAPFLVDGAQSVPHMPVDVKEVDCDFLAFSGHKMLAPMGIGVLYGKRKLLEEMVPFLYGGGMIADVDLETARWSTLPWKFEAGTPNVCGGIALGGATDRRAGRHLEEAVDYLERVRWSTSSRPWKISCSTGFCSGGMQHRTGSPQGQKRGRERAGRGGARGRSLELR